jgi:hypothetical protein
MLLGWVTFLALWFLVHLTIYDAPKHNGSIQVAWILSTNRMGTYKLIFGGIYVLVGLLCMLKCSPYEGGSSCQEPFHSRSTSFGITYRFRQTWKWSNTIIHTGGNIGVVILPWCFNLNNKNHNKSNGVLHQVHLSLPIHPAKVEGDGVLWHIDVTFPFKTKESLGMSPPTSPSKWTCT